MSYQENTINYGTFILINDGYRFVNGCNGFVKDIRNDFIHIVNKEKADATLKQCDTTLDRLQEESKIFHVDYSLISPDVKTWGNHSIEEYHDKYYLFLIKFDKDYSKRHYYTFCYLRHLYYFQTTLIKFFKFYQEDPIRRMHSFHSGGHSLFFNSFYILHKDWYKNYTYDKSNNNFVISFLPFSSSINSDKQMENYDIYLNMSEVLYYVLNGIYNFVSYKTDKKYFIGDLKSYFSGGYDSEYIYLDEKENTSSQVERKTSINGIQLKIMKKGRSLIHRLRLLSRHPSHKTLRDIQLADRVLLRLGSMTNVDEQKYTYVLNSVKAVATASNKLLMKEAFAKNKVPTPNFFTSLTLNPSEVKYPIVAKHVYGSRGSGNYLIENEDELNTFVRTKRNIKDFIFEKYINYKYEYRVHVSKLGVFLIWQKLMRRNIPENKKWIYNNDNCVFVSQDNPSFVKQNNSLINDVCLKALISVGLDIGSIDLKINKKGKLSVIEINSAPSLGEIGLQFYEKEIKKLTKCAE